MEQESIEENLETHEEEMISLQEAITRLPKESGNRFVKLFEHGSLVVEMYAPRGIDQQKPHSQDEIYVIAKGSGEFAIEGKRQAIKTGDFLFAPAGVEHRFENFSDDFFTWVMFYGPQGGEVPGMKPR